MDNIIEIKNLNKSFGEIKAVRDLSFSVERGEFFAFLGVNGAGKSTTISIICGVLSPDSGSVFIDGNNAYEAADTVKRKLGIVFQNSVLDSALSVKDNLTLRAALYGIKGDELKKRLEHLDSLLGIKEFYRRSVGKLSGGQRRRVDVAAALIHSPEILILDEPTTGLDPQSRKDLWGAVSALRRERNMTVFLTTHYMEEAAAADNVLILDGGRIAAKGTPHELKNKYTGDYITLYGVDEDSVKSLGKKYTRSGDAFRISVKDTKNAAELIANHMDMFVDFEITKGGMDDVFLAATGKKLSGGEKI